MSENSPDRPVEALRAPTTPEVVVVTGMSGAGRSTVANVMEDLGWYVIDNLPIQLLPDLVDLAIANKQTQDVRRVGVVVDVRAEGFTDLAGAVEHMRTAGWNPLVLFLDANDEALVRRFESVRRPHPLQGKGRLLDSIQAERERLSDLRSIADVVVDTSGLNVHQLSRKIHPIFAREGRHKVRLAVMSFGFKYGVPLDSDFVFDMRFLPNPFWVPELRAHTGREQAVSDYVMSQPGAHEFIDAVVSLFVPVTAGYIRENRSYATIAVGCTGGKHRSVATAEALAERLANDEISTFVVHRDLGRE
ncbi:RNase adapter RapZ [Janibacter sp. GXQ6167]|uniref:RNase adapter RapZ n=1 Tax=Janibacter sp. GXQ6167 TaxID=3240791 RepID=UPI00352381E4